MGSDQGLCICNPSPPEGGLGTALWAVTRGSASAPPPPEGGLSTALGSDQGLFVCTPPEGGLSTALWAVTRALRLHPPPPEGGLSTAPPPPAHPLSARLHGEALAVLSCACGINSRLQRGLHSPHWSFPEASPQPTSSHGPSIYPCALGPSVIPSASDPLAPVRLSS